MSKLYVVATPIGNLEDITLRALRILKEVDFILCEDTRITKKILDKYEIKTTTLSYHTFSGRYKIDKILELLEKEKNLAVVSDAGTPAISDPGFQLVSEVRERFGDRVAIIPIPGPSAVISALSISGLSADRFLFLGFLPHKKGKLTLIKEIISSNRTVIFYESPHRVLKTLKLLQDNWTIENHPRKVVVLRELTKMFEQTVIGRLSEVIQFFQTNEDKIKGEFVFVIQGK